MLAKKITLLSIGCLFLTPLRTQPEEAVPPFRLEFDASSFDIPCYGFWHPEKGIGWYGMEFTGAPHGSWTVCDEYNVGAVMVKTLDQPVPPGKCRVFMHSFVMYSPDGTNAIQISLGNIDKEGKFIIEGRSQVYEWSRVWKNKGKLGHVRTVMFPEEFELSKPVTAIEVKALKVERRFIGDVPDDPVRKILLYDFYISNDPLDEVVADGWRCRIKKNIPKKEGEPVEEKVKAISRPALPAIPSSGNILPNSSFELGVEPWWFSRGFHTDNYITSEDRDSATRVHGQYSLKIPFVSKLGKTIEPLDEYFGNIRSRPFLVKPKTKYTFSFYGKSNKEGISGRVVFFTPAGGRHSAYSYNRPTAQDNVWTRIASTNLSGFTSEWKRHLLELETGENQESLWFQIEFEGKAADAVVWLDALQCEEGPLTDYRQITPLEVGLTSAELARIHYADEPIRLRLSARQEGDQKREVEVDYRILDIRAQEVAQGTLKIPVGGQGTFEKTVEIPSFRRRGGFLINYQAKGLMDYPDQFNICVVPNPDKLGPRGKECPYLGLISSSVEPAMRLARRMGYDFECTFNDSRTLCAGLDRTWVAPDKILWADERIDRWGKYGMAVMTMIGPYFYIPGWYKDPWQTSKAKWVREKDYADYVYRVVDHYKGKIDRWFLTDELELHVGSAEEAADYLKSAYDAAKRANPEAKVGFSTWPRFLERFFELKGKNWIDRIGGSCLGYRKGFYLYERKVIREYNKPHPWHVAVGWKTRTRIGAIYDRFFGLQPDNIRQINYLQNDMAINLIRQVALVQPEMFSAYTCKWGAEEAHNQIGIDNTFNIHAVTFVNTLQFLRDVEEGDELLLNKTAGFDCYWFKKKDGVYAMISGYPSEVMLPLDSKEVEIWDRDINPREGFSGNPLKLFLPEDDLIILKAKGIPQEKLVSAVSDLKASPILFYRWMIMPDKEGINLCLYIRNHQKQSIKANLSVKGQIELKPTEVRVWDWLDKVEKVEKIVDPDKNKIKLALNEAQANLCQFPLSGTLGKGVSLGNIEISAALEEEKKFSSLAGILWVNVAPKAEGRYKVKLDGHLDEWGGQSGSYLYIFNGLMASYETVQGRYGSWAIKDEKDCSARVLSRWDKDNLYLGIEVCDDEVKLAASEDPAQPGDRIEIYLDADLLGDIESGELNKDDSYILLGPGLDKGGKAKWIHSDGQREELATVFGKVKTGWVAEVALPWKLIGFEPTLNKALGFNIVLTDADQEMKVKAQLIWTGGENAPQDPRGYGQLVLKE